MLHNRGIVLATLLVFGGAACTRQHAAAGALRDALRRAYPGARFELAFAGGPRTLQITVDSAGFRNYKLDSHQLHSLGQTLARFALQHYGEAAALDTITVQVVEERSGALLWRSVTFERESFSVAGLH